MDILKVFLYLDVEMLFRLLLAAILGLLIGIEREMKRKSLGLETILVISIVSCLLTIVSIQSSYLFPASEYTEIRMDPMRLAAQIVSGVGFLGAGVILRRQDDTVSGLTTAAIVWGAAGIGIATGAGFYIEAIAGVGLLLISVELIPFLIKKLGVKSLHMTELDLKITLDDREDINEVINGIRNLAYDLKKIRIKDLKEDRYLLAMEMIVSDSAKVTDVYNNIAKIDKIATIEIDS